MFVWLTAICHISPLCHSFIATLQLALLQCHNSTRKCWNKLILLILRFMLSFSKVLKILTLFRQDQDFFFKTKTFISRPRPFFVSSRCLETKTKVSRLTPEFLTKRQWFKRFPICNDVIVVITNNLLAKLWNWPMVNEYRSLYITLNEKLVHFFQFAAWKIGAEWERSGPKIWWAGVERWVGVKKKLAGVGGRGAGNGAGSGSHRNRFEQQVEIVLLKILPLHSHAVLVIHFYMWLCKCVTSKYDILILRQPFSAFFTKVANNNRQ